MEEKAKSLRSASVGIRRESGFTKGFPISLGKNEAMESL